MDGLVTWHDLNNCLSETDRDRQATHGFKDLRSESDNREDSRAGLCCWRLGLELEER